MNFPCEFMQNPNPYHRHPSQRITSPLTIQLRITPRIRGIIQDTLAPIRTGNIHRTTQNRRRRNGTTQPVSVAFLELGTWRVGIARLARRERCIDSAANASAGVVGGFAEGIRDGNDAVRCVWRAGIGGGAIYGRRFAGWKVIALTGWEFGLVRLA